MASSSSSVAAAASGSDEPAVDQQQLVDCGLSNHALFVERHTRLVDAASALGHERAFLHAQPPATLSWRQKGKHHRVGDGASLSYDKYPQPVDRVEPIALATTTRKAMRRSTHSAERTSTVGALKVPSYLRHLYEAIDASDDEGSDAEAAPSADMDAFRQHWCDQFRSATDARRVLAMRERVAKEFAADQAQARLFPRFFPANQAQARLFPRFFPAKRKAEVLAPPPTPPKPQPQPQPANATALRADLAAVQRAAALAAQVPSTLSASALILATPSNSSFVPPPPVSTIPLPPRPRGRPRTRPLAHEPSSSAASALLASPPPMSAVAAVKEEGKEQLAEDQDDENEDTIMTDAPPLPSHSRDPSSVSGRAAFALASRPAPASRSSSRRAGGAGVGAIWPCEACAGPIPTISSKCPRCHFDPIDEEDDPDARLQAWKVANPLEAAAMHQSVKEAAPSAYPIYIPPEKTKKQLRVEHVQRLAMNSTPW